MPGPVPTRLGITALSALVDLGNPSRAFPEGNRGGLRYVMAHRVFVLVEANLASALGTLPKPAIPNLVYEK